MGSCTSFACVCHGYSLLADRWNVSAAADILPGLAVSGCRRARTKNKEGCPKQCALRY